MSILTVQNVSFSYHTVQEEVQALRNLSFSVEEGEFVGIIGPSCCGKTTVLNLLSGLFTPTEGEILLRNAPIRKSASRIGLMPQRDQLFAWRTIEKNVCLGLELLRENTPERKEYAIGLLRKYGLGDFIKKHPSELSGGMRQRAALIRTLVIQPDLLLLDEPFSALDFQTRLSVCDDVYKIIRQEKKTAILVSHDINESISLCDKIIVLSKRPATVKEEIPVEISRELTPLQKREDKRFNQYFKKIWSLLEDTNDCGTSKISKKE